MGIFPEGIKGVIFDCDGVMIDSNEANCVYYNRILAHFGLPPMTPEQEEYVKMATVIQACQYILPEHLHCEIPNIGTNVVDYTREIMPLVKVFPGFLEFASTLHAQGIRMAVLTNRNDRGVQLVLDILHFPSYFHPVVSSSCGFSKPHPGGALLILKTWGLPARDVLFVGDSDMDREAARGAGIPFARILQDPGDYPDEDFVALGYARLAGLLAPYLPQPLILREPE